MQIFDGFKKAVDSMIMKKYPFLDSYNIIMDRPHKNMIKILVRYNPEDGINSSNPIFKKIENEIKSLYRMTGADKSYILFDIIFWRRGHKNAPNIY